MSTCLEDGTLTASSQPVIEINPFSSQSGNDRPKNCILQLGADQTCITAMLYVGLGERARFADLVKKVGLPW